MRNRSHSSYIHRQDATDDYPIIYVRYLDHTLFTDKNPEKPHPIEREAVGWLIKETSQAIWILMDKTVKPDPRTQGDVGLVILKTNILETKRLKEADRP